MPAVQRVKSTTPSFETVWVGFQEVKEIQKENAREMKEFRESQKETDRLIKILTNHYK